MKDLLKNSKYFKKQKLLNWITLLVIILNKYLVKYLKPQATPSLQNELDASKSDEATARIKNNEFVNFCYEVFYHITLIFDE